MVMIMYQWKPCCPEVSCRLLGTLYAVALEDITLWRRQMKGNLILGYNTRSLVASVSPQQVSPEKHGYAKLLISTALAYLLAPAFANSH